MYRDIKPSILEELGHGPLTAMEIAKAIDAAPFQVNAELKVLARARLITEGGHEALGWQLTDKGVKTVNATQLRLA